MTKKSVRLEICGGIASGKTTLAQLLAHASLAPVLEDFAGNPFFEKFYRAPRQYALETEITFLLQHYSQIYENTTLNLVADFSLALDLAYAQVTLDYSDKLAFAAVFNRVVEKIGPPSLIVHLHCDSTVELNRIRERHRLMEQNVSLAYLEQLDIAIHNTLKAPIFYGVPQLRIDSGCMDFRTDGADRQFVLSQIFRALDL